MKKLLLTVLFIAVILTGYSFGQSSSTLKYDAASLIDIGAGADVCADTILINGTFSGSGTICTGVMPVMLTSFTSSIKNNDAVLNWVTEAELNNSGFSVERKGNKINEGWNIITFVKGAGTCNSPVSYSYTDSRLSTGTYKYRIKQIDFNGNYEYYSLPEDVTIKSPDKFSVSQNYPNPSNPSSKIDFQLPAESRVTIKIFDIAGREVATILNDFLSADFHSVLFNGTNFASGVYFYTITAGDFIKTNKMILVK
ncbi:MAG: T9SS type A sorting domain-containing protein [Ignavibacteria bacterium]|nr:T9SS type A sorting domain-containing protein [Ignavibacteria bacterium]